jgi:hypothetical protein
VRQQASRKLAERRVSSCSQNNAVEFENNAKSCFLMQPVYDEKASISDTGNSWRNYVFVFLLLSRNISGRNYTNEPLIIDGDGKLIVFW